MERPAADVLVDTCVWSLLLRRVGHAPADHLVKPQRTALEALRGLVAEGVAWMPGPVRQELLSGVRGRAQFAILLRAVREFETPVPENIDYEYAGECANACRACGVQGSGTDFLLAALALRYRLSILTLDGDFLHFRKALPLELHAASLAGF